MLDLEPQTKRITFAALAAAAGAALVTAVLVVLLAVDGVLWWLVGCLIVLALVIAGEIVLLVLDRKAEDADGATYDFVIEAEEPGDAR